MKTRKLPRQLSLKARLAIQRAERHFRLYGISPQAGEGIQRTKFVSRLDEMRAAHEQKLAQEMLGEKQN